MIKYCNVIGYCTVLLHNIVRINSLFGVYHDTTVRLRSDIWGVDSTDSNLMDMKGLGVDSTSMDMKGVLFMIPALC